MMELQLSENIRRLRQEKNLSQEQLAQRLQVSFQTVSKWERAETYPDIMMLPRIAGFFRVTVDGLLGVNAWQEAEDVNAIIEKCKEADCHYRFDDIAPLCEEGLSRYPGNLQLRAWLAYVTQNTDPARSCALCAEILSESTDTGLRSWMERTRCHALYQMGETEKAIDAAAALPNYYDTREDVLRNLLTGEALRTHVQDEIILKLAYEFWLSVRKLLDSYTPDERIVLYAKSNAIYDACYETDDVPFKLVRKMRNYQGMAEQAFLLGRQEDGFAYLHLAAREAEKHDSLPMTVQSAALLWNAHPYEREYESFPEIVPVLRHDLETEDVFYGAVRGDARFTGILAQLND